MSLNGLDRAVKALNFTWVRRAAARGNARYQLLLALSYGSGAGVTQSYEEAARWFRNAAERGNRTAKVYLGAMYAAGEGVPRDTIHGYMWMSLAADQGSRLAREQLAWMEGYMAREQIVEAQRLAREWKPSAERVSGISTNPFACDRCAAPIHVQSVTYWSEPVATCEGCGATYQKESRAGRVLEWVVGLAPLVAVCGAAWYVTFWIAQMMVKDGLHALEFVVMVFALISLASVFTVMVVATIRDALLPRRVWRVDA